MTDEPTPNILTAEHTSDHASLTGELIAAGTTCGLVWRRANAALTQLRHAHATAPTLQLSLAINNVELLIHSVDVLHANIGRAETLAGRIG